MSSKDRDVGERLTFARTTRADLEQSIVARFEQQVRLHGNRVALKTSNQTITYSELDCLANCTAGAIVAQNKPEEKPIAILVQDFVSAIIAILGVLKSGHIYVPLNCELPLPQLRSALEDSTAPTVLTSSPNLQLAEAIVDRRHQLLKMDDFQPNTADERSSVPRAPTDLAHIVYTSGSTGIPKGVVETHRNILHHVMRVTNTARYSAEDRMTLLRAPNSGGALMNVYSALLNGACLFPLDLKTEGINGLIRLLQQENITVYHSSATVFRHFLRTLDPGVQLPHLRLIRLGSEHVLKKDVELYRRYIFSTTCTLVNSLNCTEANAILQNFITPESVFTGDIVPVGYPSEDMEILVLDESGMELASGEIGEIAVRSRFLSPGYWRKPDLTDTYFRTTKSDSRVFFTGDMGRIRSDGCLEYVGRKDYQVKIRGYQVNTNEIEMMLLGVPSIEEAAVVARETDAGDRRLVAYVVLKRAATSTVRQIRDSLAEKLPSYMMPSIFVVVSALPLASNGKIDRRALPEPPVSRPELDVPFVMPRTLVEAKLAGIWSEVLEVPHIGINDGFFELGGDSLLAGQIVARINRQFQTNITMSKFFELPTVHELSQLIMKDRQD